MAALFIDVFLIIIFIVIPAALNISLGVREIYKRFLVKLIKVSKVYCILSRFVYAIKIIICRKLLTAGLAPLSLLSLAFLMLILRNVISC